MFSVFIFPLTIFQYLYTGILNNRQGLKLRKLEAGGILFKETTPALVPEGSLEK